MTFSRIMTFIAAMVIAVAIGLTVKTLFFNDNEYGSRTIGVAAIGGPFELVNHNGEIVRDSEFSGKYLLVMFGFTNCPDVCPTGLQLISEAKELLGSEVKNVQPLMITVDPERDTIEVLADYVSNIHTSVMGLTGTVDQIKAVAGAYKAYFVKVKNHQNGDYFMDHSPFIYLMGPNGQYLDHFAPNTSPEAIANRIKSAITES